MATTVSTPIKIEYPAADKQPLELRIEAGACRLRLEPGAGDLWVSGSCDDPSGSIIIDTTVDAGRASIKVGRSLVDAFGFLSGVPELRLQLGVQRPFALSIAAGASENHFELGGLPLTRLEANHGAGSMEARWSTPVPGTVGRMKFGAGAGKTELYGLGNVPFEELLVEGGAASYLLDFSGQSLESGFVRVSTAMASVEVRIPSTLPAEVTSEVLLGHPEAIGFRRRGDVWLTPAAADGSPVKLRIKSSMVMGRLSLVALG